MDCLKINILSLSRQTKGVLLHNGIYYVGQLLKNKEDKGQSDGKNPKILDENLKNLKTDPQLTEDQLQELKREVNRFLQLDKFIKQNKPFDFSILQNKNSNQLSGNANRILNSQTSSQRQNIALMKEFTDIRQVPPEDQEENFLDMVFGVGEVTEICGLVNTGKTQICFQLCLNVQIPKIFGGVEGQALYVDTHGDFSIDRISEMSKHLRSQVLKKIDKDPQLLKQYKEEFTIEKILSKLHYVRLLDMNEQQLFHIKLSQVLQKLQNVKLIVLDTFCEHFKTSEQSYNQWKRFIAQSLMSLQQIAYQHNVAIVLINNMKAGKKEFFNKNQQSSDGTNLPLQNTSGKPVPLLGEDLFQCVTNRIQVERDHNSTEDNIIRAKLVKASIASNFASNPTAHFQIFEKGIASII